MGRCCFMVYLPTFPSKSQPNIGKSTSPMDPTSPKVFSWKIPPNQTISPHWASGYAVQTDNFPLVFCETRDPLPPGCLEITSWLKLRWQLRVPKSFGSLLWLLLNLTKPKRKVVSPNILTLWTRGKFCLKKRRKLQSVLSRFPLNKIHYLLQNRWGPFISPGFLVLKTYVLKHVVFAPFCLASCGKGW